MRMMVVFEKGEGLRYIGHLDLMRTMQRALRRSGLPIQYSNGFNPHIRLSFAVPLSVGVIGLNELMEVPLSEEVREECFIEKMNAVLPSQIRICSCHTMADEHPALMSMVAGADYILRFCKDDNGQKAAQAFPSFMALEHYETMRHTKSGDNLCDIRPFVRSGEIRETEDEFVVTLCTITMKSGMLKPSLWFESLCDFAGIEPFVCSMYRSSILALDKQGKLCSMESLA